MVSPSQRTGTAQLPLHGGKAPPWLFHRMVWLGGEMVRVIAEEHGPEEVLRCLSRPVLVPAPGLPDSGRGVNWLHRGTLGNRKVALRESIHGKLQGYSRALS
ncbi:MAG: DUF763 domain-containing protein [Chloroflexi bacterium]|nr:DUF763 domain-containing protein [Chloroflexota bacterium]